MGFFVSWRVFISLLTDGVLRELEEVFISLLTDGVLCELEGVFI